MPGPTLTGIDAALRTPSGLLPLAFLAIMDLALLACVILGGYDLGVGVLLRAASDSDSDSDKDKDKDKDKDTMVASIGPFWDANETGLVLGVGISLVAFPSAHGAILGALHLPEALMLTGWWS